VRAEAATMRQVFPEVVLFELPGTPDNHVLVGSNMPIDVAAIDARAKSMHLLLTPMVGARLQGLIGDANVLDDDFAPVDQLVR
jgi:hypothetical protein